MAESSQISQLAHANTAFGLNLYKQATGVPGSNVFLSPFSISTALAMTFMGARGTTAQQMASTLQWPSELPVHEAFQQYLTKLQGSDQRKYQLATANRIYMNHSSTFLDAFITSCKQYFQTEHLLANFSGDAEGERNKINQWVKEITQGKIKDLISEGALTPLTRLVLINAIYFKGNWATQFKPEKTFSGTFKLGQGREKKCNMMSIKKHFKFCHDDNLHCTVLELPYIGDDLSMVILLPTEEDGLPSLEQKLTSETLSAAIQQTHSVEVDVHLPKFKVESSFKLNGVLQALGIKDLFIDGKADLSGINGKHDLYVSAVLHKAFVEVNEEGTEAAAATATIMFMRSLPIVKNFHADHPFLFVIRENKSDMILFLGRLVDPE